MTCGISRVSDRGPDRARQRGGIDEDVFKKFADCLSYVQGDYMDRATYERLKKALSPEAPGLLPEIPPSLFAGVIQGLGSAGLRRRAPGW